jgi:CheY-like chemotaxis protein
MLRQHLRSWGALPTEVASAEEALAELRNALPGEFDAIIIDAHLPGTSVPAMVSAVRATGGFSDTPILLMHTGAGDPPREARLLGGQIAWQNKPLRRSQMEDTLARLLGYAARHGTTWPPANRVGTEPGASPVPGRSRIRRVLVVEDNPVNQEVAREMLNSLGIEACIATGGAEALEVLARERFDAVLMDCEMPLMDGYMATEKVREWERQQARPRMPIVALTANGLQGDDQRCFAAGMDHHLSKPYSALQLHAVLELCADSTQAPLPGQPAGTDVLDRKVLEQVGGLGDKPRAGLVAKLVALYASSSMELVTALRHAANRDDMAAARQAAHALRSSSLNVGANNLAEACRELEWAVRQRKPRLAFFLVERIIGEHDKVLRALDAKGEVEPGRQSA